MLTRKQVEELTQELCDNCESEAVELLAHDASQRIIHEANKALIHNLSVERDQLQADLAAMTQVKDEQNILIDSAANDLSHAQRRIAQLEADNAKACQIIKAGFELGTITQADIEWAKHALEGK